MKTPYLIATGLALFLSFVGQGSEGFDRDYNSSAFDHVMKGDLCSENDSDFDGYRYSQRIPHCQRNVSVELKRYIARKFGINHNFHDYQIDHFFPLSIGGNNSERNLWPLPVREAEAKSELEKNMFEQVAAGELSQAEALNIMRNWRTYIH